MKILKGNLVSAPVLGKLEIAEHGCLVLHDDGSFQSVEKAAPQNADAEVIDYVDNLIMPSFVDMHLNAPQYPMLGMGMDLPLIDWLNTYTFKTCLLYTSDAFELRARLVDDIDKALHGEAVGHEVVDDEHVVVRVQPLLRDEQRDLRCV